MPSAAIRRHRIKRNRILALKVCFILVLLKRLLLIPGTSRFWYYDDAARFWALVEKVAARFSFLLSIPLILAAGGLKLVELVSSNVAVDWISILVGVILSALSAYFCIYLFFKMA